MSLVKSYRNGSYRVQINTETGSKYFFGDDLGFPDFPDSIDLKITDHCLIGCPFCYEGSSPQGKHAKASDIRRVFRVLPEVPLEVAIGGGDPLDNIELPEIIEFLTDRGHIVNMTISCYDVGRGIPMADRISGLGISLGSTGPDHLPAVDPVDHPWRQTVWHAILGVTPTETITELLDRNQKVLVLGYKNMGRGKTKELPGWNDTEVALKKRIHSKTEPWGTLSFDELAVQQLSLQGTVFKQDWDLIWLGPEFSHSMFVDAVKGMFYPSSTDRARGVSWDTIGIMSYFKENHVRDINKGR